MNAAIETFGVTARYGRVLALDDVTIALPEGSMTAIIGPNGAGKSTLIKAMVGAVPMQGEVRIAGRSQREGLSQIAYVSQRRDTDADFPATVRDVVTQGVYPAAGWFRRLTREHRDRVAAAMQATGVEALADRPIDALSGGQQQRAFLARALAQDRPIALLDEPFAGVDAATEDAVVAVLREMRNAGRTVVVVHHDLSTVRSYFDHAVLLSTRLVSAGPIETAFTPETVRATYGGSVAVFDRPAGREAS